MDKQDSNQLMAVRAAKLAALREQGVAFPNNFSPDNFAADVHAAYHDATAASLAEQAIVVKLAGRMMSKRQFGKASFVHIQDMTGRIQLYLRQDSLGNEAYAACLEYDLGDIIGVVGTLFITKTAELSVQVTTIALLTKALRPLPDKFHGLHEQELCYRQRYLDLITNQETRSVFLTRTKLINNLRQQLQERRFIEVETPMMQPLAGGATAKPFVTHHNALDMTLYLRVAPELYLKRLVVGGLERVFELNRNFRNEGLSTRHNPEFTMLEFYQAYANYRDAIHTVECLLANLVQALFASYQVPYRDYVINFTPPFTVLTVRDAVLRYCPELSTDDLTCRETLLKLNPAASKGVSLETLIYNIFEERVEAQLIQPTFIVDIPSVVSPLARAHDDNPDIAERFELFVAGYELANGFSELNDPKEQQARFAEQMANKAAGDEEAMPYDHDYITALEHGLPPSAGVGIGIDRLTMLCTNSTSIKDVILFPHLRPK